MLSNEQVMIICESIKNNPNITNSELFKIASIDVSTKELRNKMRHCIESIKCGKAYTDISAKYNIINRWKFNDYPVREYTQVSGNGEPRTGNAEGEDIV